MASSSLLSSAASSFHGHSPLFSARFAAGNPSNVAPLAVRIKASAGDSIVLVEKAEAEKTNRLKSNYLERIVPLLMDEFSYTNIHQVLTDFFWYFGW